MNVIEYLTDKFMPSDKFTLEYWEIYVCDGMSAAIHNDFIKVVEIYVPELNLTINQYTKPVNVFIGSKDRYVSTKNMSGHTPKLIKSIKIFHDSETGNTLKWFANLYKEKKEKENKLVKLFL